MTEQDTFFTRGWVSFPFDSSIAAWARAIAPIAQRAMAQPDAHWRCDGTWFPGVNILPNDSQGGISKQNVPPLTGVPICFINNHLGLPKFHWDQGQISACTPGYPRQGDEETDAAFRYRMKRDAAHIDGFLRVMPGRRRRFSEGHAFILGIPLNATPPGASPFVIWEGSHAVVRRTLRDVYTGTPAQTWSDIDLTDVYQQMRKQIFDCCPRVEIQAQPGETYVVHRLALHGMAPWTASESVSPRIIAYFRPDPFPGCSPVWRIEHP
jgi:hypothetical protein